MTEPKHRAEAGNVTFDKTRREERLNRLVDEVRRKRLELAGQDNYAEGYWHGIAAGMLAIFKLEERYGGDRKPHERKA